MKEDALVLRETEEIMSELPHQLRHDEEILDAVIGSLQQGQSAISVRQDAQEIAMMKLESKVDKGFELVSSEFQKVRHEAKIDRIHAEYAQKEAQQAADKAEKAYEKAQEATITAARADAKADGAKDVAVRANRLQSADPLLVMLAASIFVVGILALSARFQFSSESSKSPDQPAPLICGRDLPCNIPMQPANNFKGGV